jgi:putative FmdB family regulatory protein
MPIYEYRCENGHLLEVMQRMSDDPLTACETCDAPVQRVFHPVAVHFKGNGFYNTDYGTRKRQRELTEAGEGTSSKDGAAAESTSSGETSSKSETASSNGSSPAKTAGAPAAKAEKAA